MAIVKCLECGQNVSDKAKTCIHCGAPLNVKNGEIRIKCQYLNGSLMKAKITNIATGEVIATMKQGAVVNLTITEDTDVEISFFGLKSTTGTLKYEGMHNYEISSTSGFFLQQLALNEVTNIDAD